MNSAITQKEREQAAARYAKAFIKLNEHMDALACLHKLLHSDCGGELGLTGDERNGLAVILGWLHDSGWTECMENLPAAYRFRELIGVKEQGNE